MVMPKFTSKIGLCLVSFILVIIGCSDPTYISVDTNSSEREVIVTTEDNYSNETIKETYQRLVSEKPTAYFKNWTYDAIANNITIDITSNTEAAEALHQHKLWLGFDQHIAKENPKTFKYISTHPLSQMDDNDTYNVRLQVNGEPFSGALIGIHTKSNKKILEAQFYGGKRLGSFNVWTEKNGLHTKSFNEDIIISNPGAVRKPIVYLYPTQKEAISVKVDFKGELTHTYPKYDPKAGWNVIADTDGTLLDPASGKTYPYLFWEGKSDFQYTLTTGNVIAGEATADFLDNTLAHLGLNRREATDFITYWLPELEQNPYNLIHFSTQEYQDNASMQITPTPATLIRIFMVYQPLNSPIEMTPQKFDPKPNREGFTVVEWGGKKANQPYNPFAS